MPAIDCYHQQLFQSALPRGERQHVSYYTGYECNFNPRSREGSDCKFNLIDCGWEISIRAPARGATGFAV